MRGAGGRVPRHRTTLPFERRLGTARRISPAQCEAAPGWSLVTSTVAVVGQHTTSLFRDTRYATVRGPGQLGLWRLAVTKELSGGIFLCPDGSRRFAGAWPIKTGAVMLLGSGGLDTQMIGACDMQKAGTNMARETSGN